MIMLPVDVLMVLSVLGTVYVYAVASAGLRSAVPVLVTEDHSVMSAGEEVRT